MRVALSGVLLTFGLAACGGLSQSDVRQAWAAAQAVATQGYAPTGLTNSSNGAFSTTVQCNGGGSADFSGTVSGTSASTGATGSFDLTVNFKSCTENGQSINGKLQYSVDASSSSTASSVNVKYASDGSVDFNGQTCDGISLTASMSASAAGYSMTYSGTICGYDASSTLTGTAG